MAGPVGMERPMAAPSLADPDWQVWTVAQLFVFGSMRGLFSMLFGIGLLLFFERAGKGDGLYLRRLLLLFLFGVANGTVLLWPGDILTTYAVAGLAVLAFRDKPPQSMLIAGLVAIGLMSLLMSIEVGMMPSENFLYSPETLATETAARQGDYAANLAYLSHVTAKWTLDLASILWVAEAAGFMMIGMALWRSGWMEGRRPRLLIAGYAIGLPLRIAQAIAIFGNDGNPTGWTAMVDQVARFGMTIGHIGLVLTLWPHARSAFAPFARMGRMALTLYLGQSALAAVIFSGFGLGLWGRLNGWGEWGVAALILVAEALFATFWFARFRYGPMEWLWRWGTYGRRPGA
ncbi:DUF418 domain-containing protein [Sphingomonas crocodyli]|uniref:DUF418 domain-containing protein n=2 Tax=Sphingomonas crocodyli TaxID=1979270 RepID=A0A437M068_9SPHN|nr:DUF418 domain-containing protein [Sphingomonas crocodyli]